MSHAQQKDAVASETARKAIETLWTLLTDDDRAMVVEFGLTDDEKEQFGESWFNIDAE